MLNVDPLTAEIGSGVWGTLAYSTGFTSWLCYCTDIAQWRSTATKLCTMFGHLLSWYTICCRMRCAALLRVRLTANTSDMLCVKSYLLSSHGMRRHIVYSFLSVTSVGHAFNKVSKVWQQISRRQVVRRGQNLAHWYSGLAVSTSELRLVNFGSVVPLGTEIVKGVKNFFVTLFSYIVWPSAMKFGSVRGLANRNLFPEFRELWSECPAMPCGDMHQSFTDALVMYCNCRAFDSLLYDYCLFA